MVTHCKLISEVVSDLFKIILSLLIFNFVMIIYCFISLFNKTLKIGVFFNLYVVDTYRHRYLQYPQFEFKTKKKLVQRF